MVYMFLFQIHKKFRSLYLKRTEAKKKKTRELIIYNKVYTKVEFIVESVEQEILK